MNEMSITDELRKWWVRKFPVMDKELHEDFTAIADRIDAEHERMQYDFQREFDEWKHDRDACWVKLPKDADGVPIHVGDVMESGDGGVFVVSSVDYGRHSSRGDGEFWMLWSEDADFYECADECRNHAPTIEDVLREFADKWMDVQPYREPEIIAEYAAKLQLRGDAE